jgi:hypothetical protein
MTAKLEIILLQFDQPKESTWREILSFAEKWNQEKESRFITDVQFELVIYFDDENDEELKELENLLDQKHEERKWEWIKTITNDPTKQEIEAHDYIQIIGDGYPDEFFLNESDALSSFLPCKTCGTIDPHLRTQKKALQVDETLLTKKGEPNDQYTPNGLDIINMPHGALLVTKRVVELINSNEKLSGYKFLDVLNKQGKISEKLFQLTTDKIILVPDNLTEEGAYCPTCGTVLSTMTRGFVVKKGRLGKSSFFARHPSGISSIYISKSLYQILQSENIRGLTPVQGADVIS